MKVYVVICPANGWDNIVGIYEVTHTDIERLTEEFPDDEYIILEKRVE